MARFIYHNENPQNKRISDCVTRAITLATGLDYSEVRKKLFHIAKLLNCHSKLCPACYRHLLEDIFKFEQVYCEGYTVGEFADAHPEGIYILRVPSHLTAIIDGDLHDTFDCLNALCDIAWKVE